ncbi:MAG TPA: carboxypeptidase regulatory-like domain-containing protein, partial [Bacteroidales bacterium]
MKRLILFLFFWNIVVEITLAQSGYGKINGTITDIHGQALLGVAVGLILPSDSSTVKSTISDENGRFVIQHIPNNTYLLVYSYLGYETYKTVPLKIDSYHTSIALPMIVMLKKNILLKEVSVTASKPLIQHKTDRTIVNVDAMGTAAGSNILEVIGKSPGVMIDVNGDITLNGKGSVLVLIDERPTYLSAQELSGYLSSIPAGVVERIELIGNPSARYDAANGAIINIVLKKNKIEGFNGNLDLGYNQGYYSRTNDALNLNYRKNKVSVFSNLSFNRSRNFNEETLHRSFYNPDKSLESEIVSDKRYSYLSNGLSVRLGTDYFASPKTTIGFLLAGTTRPKNDQQTFSGMQTDSNLRPENTTDGFSDGSYKWKSGGINFNFKHRFDTTGTTLSADLDYIIYKSDGNQTLTDREKYTDSSDYSSHTLLYDLPSQINIYAVKTDFTHPF